MMATLHDMQLNLTRHILWDLNYIEGLNRVLVACWQYASRADEAYAAGYEHAHSTAEEALYAANNAITKYDAALASLSAKLNMAVKRAAKYRWQRDWLAAQLDEDHGWADATGCVERYWEEFCAQARTEREA